MFSDAIAMSAESTASVAIAAETVGAAVMEVMVVVNAVAAAGYSADGNTLPIGPWRI